MDGGPIPLEIYARALAELLHRRGEGLDAVLARLSLDRDEFRRAHGGVRGGETAALPTAATGAPLPFAQGAPGARIEFTREAPPLARQDTGTLPPAQPSATPTYQPAAHELTLEQYAQVSAELALSSDLASVLRRYRLAEPTWREQARLWDDRVKRDTRLQVRCMEVLRALQRAPR